MLQMERMGGRDVSVSGVLGRDKGRLSIAPRKAAQCLWRDWEARTPAIMDMIIVFTYF